MNLFPPAISAALLRAQTGFLGGGGLPPSSQELSLEFSNLAQRLATSGLQPRRPYHQPLDPTQSTYLQPDEGFIPDPVQALLPDFLRNMERDLGMESRPTSQEWPARRGLPGGVNRLLPDYLQPKALEGEFAGTEQVLPEPPNRGELVRSGNEIIRRMNASGRNGFLEGELAEPTGPEGEGTVDYERGEFYSHANEPGGEEDLPLGVRRRLPAFLQAGEE